MIVALIFFDNAMMVPSIVLVDVLKAKVSVNANFIAVQIILDLILLLIC